MQTVASTQALLLVLTEAATGEFTGVSTEALEHLSLNRTPRGNAALKEQQMQ